MREILFRGKREDNDEWVEGCFITSDSFTSDCAIGYLSSELHHIDEVDVIPETVGQYTGLKDKNGTKIFEGDFIQEINYSYPRGVVIQKNCEYVIDLGKKDNYTDRKYEPLYKWVSVSSMEVVGNIHDNPELLGGMSND